MTPRTGPRLSVWVTRTQPGAHATAARLKAIGCAPRVAPLLSVRRTPDALDLSGVGALAFTSAHGVAAFAERCGDRTLRVFCVGDGTAEAARAAGFGRIRSAAGDLDDLVRLIVSAKASIEGVVLRPGAARPAGDLVGRLALQDIPARSAVVYATTPAPLRGELVRIWRQPDDIAATLLYSRRAAQRLADLCTGLRPPPGVVVCISQAAAEPLCGLGFEAVVVAARPTEAAMVARVIELRSDPCGVARDPLCGAPGCSGPGRPRSDGRGAGEKTRDGRTVRRHDG